MKLWWMIALNVALTATTVWASQADEIPIKDDKGTTLAVLIVCNDCQSGASKPGCHPGAENGWLKGQPCGQCLIKANQGVMIEHGNDIHLSGTLTDEQGTPAKNRFIKLFLPNGWGHRTKTTDSGQFRMKLGGTAEKRLPNPVILDIGSYIDSVKESDQNFALFMLPPNYKHCSAAEGAKPSGDKQSTDGEKATKGQKQKQ